MGEWGDAFNYDHASKRSVKEAFDRLKKLTTAYENKGWIFELIDNAALKKLHQYISDVISQINKVEKFYGYYIYVRDMRKALDTLDVQLAHGQKKTIAKAYGSLLYNAGMLLGAVPLFSYLADGLKTIGSKFEAIVTMMGRTHGNDEYEFLFVK